VGIVLTLEPKTANLAIAPKEAGADVSVFCHAASTIDSVAAGLHSLGINVYARSDADSNLNGILMNRFADNRIEFLVDDNAIGTRYIHAKRKDVLPFLKGIAEETTSGLRPIRVMEKEGALKAPCMAVNDARAKQLFDNVYGTGQSVVMTMVDVTNTQLQGKRVVVVGYGFVGKGIALTARALGARVIVTEIDPIRALQAISDGYSVKRLETVSSSGDVFFTATGIGFSLTADHMRLMKNGAIVSVGGSGPPEIDLSGARPLQRGEFAREHVRSLPLDDNRTIFLIGDGECSNVSAGEGNPIEIMDLSFAVQLRTLKHLVENEGTLEPAVYPVPEEIDLETAKSLIKRVGAELDTPSKEQIAYATEWRHEELT
jgi:adenosylhomocysteinase